MNKRDYEKSRKSGTKILLNGIALVLIFMTLMFIMIPKLCSAATLKGKIYNIDLKELNDVIVEVNSTPWQRMVSKDGSYSFDLPPGTYELRANYTNKNLKALSSKDIVKIPPEQGTFVFDIFLFGNIDEEMKLLDDNEAELDDGNDIIPEQRREMGVTTMVTAAIILAIVFIYAYYWRRKNEREELKEINRGVNRAKRLVRENPPDEQVKEVLEDLEEKERLEKEKNLASDTEIILEILKKEGGRATQKEIRKHIPLSEAKVSLMIAELENEGKIKKVKKGRGNIIILTDA